MPYKDLAQPAQLQAPPLGHGGVRQGPGGALHTEHSEEGEEGLDRLVHAPLQGVGVPLNVDHQVEEVDVGLPAESV